MKPYYDEGGITIYHGDCLDVMPTLLAEPLPDLVLADPPYNVGMEYGEYEDNIDAEAYELWCAEWFRLCRQFCWRTIIFPGHGNLPVWWEISPPSAIGCWYKPGANRSSVIGFVDWEPWLYWTGDKGILGGSSVITAPVGRDGESDHPCPKPVRLCRKLILKAQSQFVLDPFMGSGTTLRAAKDLGRRAIGIEIEERYCEIAVKRLAQEVLDVAA